MSDNNNLEEFLPDVSSETLSQYRNFFDLIVKYNKKINLVSRQTISELALRHFVDCHKALNIVSAFSSTDAPIYDLGSGNGFPGIIMAINYPMKNFVLVERDQRKAQFLKIALGELSLKNVTVMNCDLSHLNKGQCQNVVSRAMSPLNRFLIETRSIVAPGGQAFLMKSDQWSTELGACQPILFDYWSAGLHSSYKLPDKNNSEKFIVICERIDKE